MDIAEYKELIYEDIKVNADANIADVTSEFINYAADMLIEAEEFNDFTECYFETVGKQNKRIQIDGFQYDEVDNSLVLLICNFTNDISITTITNTDIDRLYERIKAFIDHSINGYIRKNCEESSEGYGVALQIEQGLDEISKFRLYIITDQLISKRIKSVKKDNIQGKPVELNVWDISRFRDVAVSKINKESIEISFENYGLDGLQCIKGTESEKENYKAYLMAIPGNVLAQIYIEYGARLLEGNVRSFLSNKRKVNKQIRETIIKTPEMFFAYNNGIAATASEVEFKNDGFGMIVSKIKDLQIINGGQTTASIANVVLKKEGESKGDVSKIVVPMKLSVVDFEKSEEIIPNISRCANSQNKIDEADFSSNHPFHIRMEDYSRKLLTPAINGNQYGTIWFYERARGQYVQAQMKLSSSEREAFIRKSPKSQLIKKVDLAKCINTYECRPDIVSKGSQESSRYFYESMKKEWDKSDTIFNALYFKRMVSLAILYKCTENIVSEQQWYKETKSYRANIVTYSIAVVNNYINNNYSDKELDLKRIWNQQKLFPELEEQLVKTTYEVFRFLTMDNGVMKNVTQWCKNSLCWEKAKKESWTLIPNFNSVLVDRSDIRDEEAEAKITQKVSNEVDAVMEIINVGSQYWKRMRDWANERQLLNPIEKNLLDQAIKTEFGKIPTSRNAKNIIALRDKISLEGFY